MFFCLTANDKIQASKDEVGEMSEKCLVCGLVVFAGWMLSFRPNAKGQAFVGKKQVRFWLPSKVGGCLFYCVDDRKIPKAR